MRNFISLFVLITISTLAMHAQSARPIWFNSYGSKMVSFFPHNNSTSTDFYGMGLGPGKLRFQVISSSTNSHSFGFFNGFSDEIATLNTDASWTLRGRDPDMTLSIDNNSPNNLVQLRFAVSGSILSEMRYDRNADQIQFVQGSDNVMTLDHNASDYWVTIRKGLRTGRVKTEASLADYVFTPDYTPMPLPEVEQYVWENHHLPGVISQPEVDEQGGVDLTAFTVQLQEKVEELYLHLIEMDKRIKELESENQQLREKK